MQRATTATNGRLRIAAAIAILATAFASRSASAAPLEQTVVFAAGDGGYNTFRIPAIVTAADGSLLAFAEGRKNSASDTGDIDTVLRRSVDGGRTWGAIQVVGNDAANTFGNPSPVVDRRTGRVLLLTTHNFGQDSQSEIQNGTSDGGRTVWVQQSDDNGGTWSAAREITGSVKSAASRWYATGPGHAIQLERGPHAGRIIGGANFDEGAVDGAMGIYSDDGGLTWQRGSAVTSSGTINPSESEVVELVDGRLQLNSRNRGGTARSRAVAYSNDGGTSFGSKRQASELIDPAVQGSVVRFSAVDHGDVKNRILFANPANASSRVNMTVRSSFDETATWNAGKRIYRGPSAYSDLVAYGDARAGLLYENGANSPYEKISFASWSDGWLEDPTIMQIDFREPMTGMASSATGAMKDRNGYGLNGTAIGGPTYVAGAPRFGRASALQFTSGSDAIRIPDGGANPLDFEAKESFTLETIFRTTDHGAAGADNSGPLISKDVGSNQPSYWLRVEGGAARFLISDNTTFSSVTTSVPVNDGLWHHLAAVRDVTRDELRIYVDFVLVGTANDVTTGSLANASDLMIGAFNNASPGTKQFIGDIDFARVSLGALDPLKFAITVPEPAMLSALPVLTLSTRRRRIAI